MQKLESQVDIARTARALSFAQFARELSSSYILASIPLRRPMHRSRQGIAPDNHTHTHAIWKKRLFEKKGGGRDPEKINK